MWIIPDNHQLYSACVQATEDEKVYFFEPLEKEISVGDMQKIVDANEKLVKEIKDGTNENESISWRYLE